MAKYALIPTKKIRNEAKVKKEDPFEYLENKTYSIPKDAGYDERRKDKLGYEYLQDILIIRDDDSKIIIHEIESDIASLKKVELSEFDQNDDLTKTINAYTDGLDFSKMQSDKEYLDRLANSLLSHDRIESKELKAKAYGLNEIYIGSLQRDRKNDHYVKMHRKSDDLMLSDILAIKKELKLEKEKKEKERIETQNKFKMIKAINSKLQTMSLEDLSKLCELLKISIDDPNLDNSR